jgi:tetratricopeptide (TPR) repeat protein
MNKNKVIKTANKYVKKGQIDKAIGEWEKFLQKNDGDGNTYNSIGDLYLRKNKKEEAIESFKKAADFFKNDGFVMKAMALYKKALNIKPDEVESLVALAELNVEKGLINNATDNYFKAIDISKNNGETDRVIELIERVLAYDSHNITLRKKIAEIYATSDMKKHSSDEYCKIAYHLEKQNDKKGAYQYYKKALEVNEASLEALKGLSSLEEGAHNIKSALYFLRKAVKISQTDSLFSQDILPDIYINFVELSLKIDDIKNAKIVLQKLLESEPSHRKGKMLLGRLHVKEGLIEEAWKELAGFIDEYIEEKSWHDAFELLDPFREAKPIEAGSRLALIYKNTDDRQAHLSQLWLLAKSYEKAQLVREALQSYHEISMLAPDDKKCKERIEKLNEKLIDEIDEFGKVAESNKASIEDTAITTTLDDSLKRVEILISYDLYKDAKETLEQLKTKFPGNAAIENKYQEVLSMIQSKEDAADINAPQIEPYKEEIAITDEPLITDEQPITEEALLLEESLGKEYGGHDLIQDDSKVIIEDKSDRELPAGVNPEEYEENLYEADFYVQQGLIDEAIAIYERLRSITPDNKEIIQKLEAAKSKESVTYNPVDDMPVIVGEEETTSFSLSDEEESEEDTSDVQMDKAVMDVFQQFKESVDKEVSVDDYETHYELGIAYREMGMLDDAVQEFRYNGNDINYMIKSAIMLSQCYLDKELYEEALQEYLKIMQKVSEDNELYLELQYSMSEIFEKIGQSEKAIIGYKKILQKDPSFRDVSKKIASFEKAGI